MGRANLSNRNSNRLERDNLEGSVGYVSSGEGMWSRNAASAVKVETPPLPVRVHGEARTLLQQKIANAERTIKYMELALRDPNCKRRDALIRDLNIRYRQMTALYIERGD